MKGIAPSYDELLRQLEAERHAPPTPPVAAPMGELAPTTATQAAERRAQLYADSIAYGEGKDLRSLKAVS